VIEKPNYNKDGKQNSRTDSKQPKIALFEKLEPRILLSADSLLIGGVPDPLQDSMEPIVQYVELSEADELIEQQPIEEQEIDQQVNPSCMIGALQPILTLTVEESKVDDRSNPSILDPKQAYSGVVDEPWRDVFFCAAGCCQPRMA